MNHDDEILTAEEAIQILERGISAVSNFLNQPLDRHGKMDLPPPENYRLTGRKVVAGSFPCTEGHRHRIMQVVETYGRVSSTPDLPVVSLSECFDQVREKAGIIPPDCDGLCSRNITCGWWYDDREDIYLRAMSLDDAFALATDFLVDVRIYPEVLEKIFDAPDVGPAKPPTLH